MSARGELIAANARIRELEAQLEAAREANDLLRTGIAKLEAQSADLRERLEDAGNPWALIDEGSTIVKRSELDELRADHADAEQRRLAANAKVRDLREDVETLRLENEALREQLDDCVGVAVEHVDRLRDDAIDLRAERDRVHEANALAAKPGSSARKRAVEVLDGLDLNQLALAVEDQPVARAAYAAAEAADEGRVDDAIEWLRWVGETEGEPGPLEPLAASLIAWGDAENRARVAGQELRDLRARALAKVSS